MGNEHTRFCRKEKEIAEIHADLQIIKKIVMGNGQEGLAVSVPKLSLNVDKLGKSVDGLKTGVNGFLKYQQAQEGKDAGKNEVKRRTRWIIGLMIGLITTLLGLLVYAIHQLIQMGSV
jgi:hypothetical protein